MPSETHLEELLAILGHARRTARLARSEIHGEQHWQCVARIGSELARATTGADLRTVLLFSVLHDSRRENEHHDPEHGYRAGELVDELASDGRLTLEADWRSRLREAVGRHNDGETTLDPTVAVCWDADRLCLPRVGITPDPVLLSTRAAPAFVGWARPLLMEPLEDWRAILAAIVSRDPGRIKDTCEWTIGTEIPQEELRVWLDDLLEDRAAPPGWVHVTSAPAAIALIDSGTVVELSLDHDLGDDAVAGKGVHVVDYIAEQQIIESRDLWPRDGITIHSANAAGRDQMVRAIERYAAELHTVRRTTTPSGKPRLTFG